MIGDGAVGLCGVIAAKRLGAEENIVLGRHPDRTALAREFGATAMVDQAVGRLERLDVAFNNAGIMVPPTGAGGRVGRAVRPGRRDHLRGVWACMKHELRQMRTQGGGAVVNNSSLGGLVGLAQRGASHASKQGVIGLTKSAAHEFTPLGIRINALCPGGSRPVPVDGGHTAR